MSRDTILKWLAVFLFIGLVSAALIFTFSIRNVGVVKTFGLECDTNSIDWGMVGAGETVYRTVNFRGNGSVPIGNMSFVTENWNPSVASGYIGVAWNYTGGQIGSDWVPIQFSLTVFSNVTGVENFNFDLVVVAVE